MPRRVAVIGIGNSLRGDDGAGIEAVRRIDAQRLPPGVSIQAHEGEAVDLLDLWEGAEAVLIIDTVRTGAPPGTIHGFDAGATALPASIGSTSSHLVSAAEAIELARALGKLPATVRVVGIEGGHFVAGAGLSAEVARAMPELVREVCNQIAKVGTDRV